MHVSTVYCFIHHSVTNSINGHITYIKLELFSLLLLLLLFAVIWNFSTLAIHCLLIFFHISEMANADYLRRLPKNPARLNGENKRNGCFIYCALCDM